MSSVPIEMVTSFVENKTTRAFHTDQLPSILLRYAGSAKLRKDIESETKWHKKGKAKKWIRKVFKKVLAKGESNAKRFCSKLCHDKHLSPWWQPEIAKRWMSAIRVGLTGAELEQYAAVALKPTDRQRDGKKHFEQTMFTGTTGTGKSTLCPLLMYLAEVGLNRLEDSPYNNEGILKKGEKKGYAQFEENDWETFGCFIRETFIRPTSGDTVGECLVIPESMPQNLIQVVD